MCLANKYFFCKKVKAYLTVYNSQKVSPAAVPFLTAIKSNRIQDNSSWTIALQSNCPLVNCPRAIVT